MFCNSFFTWKYVWDVPILVLGAPLILCPLAEDSKGRLYNYFLTIPPWWTFQLFMGIFSFLPVLWLISMESVSLRTCGSISLWQMSRGGMLGWTRCPFHTGWRLSYCPSQWPLQPSRPPRESPFPSPSPTLNFISLLKCSHSNEWEMTSSKFILYFFHY